MCCSRAIWQHPWLLMDTYCVTGSFLTTTTPFRMSMSSLSLPQSPLCLKPINTIPLCTQKLLFFSSYFLYRFPLVNTWLSSEPKTCLSQKDPHLPSPCCSRLPLSFPTSTISPSPCPPPSLSPSPPFLLRTPKSPNSCHANWSWQTQLIMRR